jgi:pSer/pThr/pTyr-binding forkhead associated (FHA) protein
MENGFYIEDLDTKNGTFVNNDKLQAFKKRKLHEGDEIVIANLHIKYFEKSHLR